MPTVSDNQLIGNWGEQLIAERLTRAKCMVRHVPQGHDTGIDLYCESVENNEPFLHFLIQVKTGSSYTSLIRDHLIPLHPFKSHEQYFMKQTIPVLIAVVSDEQVSNPTVFMFSPQYGDATHYRLVGDPLCNDSDYTRLVTVDLPLLTHEWSIARGILRPIPSPQPRSIGEFAVGTTYDHEKPIRQTIIFSLWRLSEDIIRRNRDLESFDERPDAPDRGKDLNTKVRGYVRAFSALIDDPRPKIYQFQVTLGMFEELEGNLNEAQKRYLIALDYIPGDQHLVQSGTVDKHLETVNKYLARVRKKTARNEPA